ncbi:MAG: ATP-binding protein, partial [Solirubrobacterales bacterium]
MPEPRQSYPFSAVVGQDDYKLALLANAVDPSIGGVLAVGERGTAKSTLARSFASLLPQLESDEDESAPSAPFVELPLGATVDRLTGSLDTAKLLAGEGAELTDGLLAAADRGVLYADEVNLLGDHLVDVLLDAAAFGSVRIERDGLSEERDARFILVGTMNPEEGALRPQLLDRFGLSVTIAAPLETSERAEIVQRRIAFEQYPGMFCERFEGTEDALRDIVQRARAAWLD